MKKLFPDEKGRKKSLVEILDKKGFYIVLLLCIAIVGGVAIYVTTRNANINDLDRFDANNIIADNDDEGYDSIAEADTTLDAREPIGTAAILQEDSVEANASVKATPEPEKDDKPEATPKPNTGASSIQTNNSSNEGGTASKAANAKAEEKPEFIMPVFGEVSFEYAMDRLVYSKTLEEWRTHEGVDLAAERGTPVKAVADGVVSEIKNDPRYGVVVIIDHKNGIKTVYSNLASDDMVTSNQKVKQGDVIGSVGNTALFESAEQPHLHFEVLVDNEPVDPMAYLPVQDLMD